MYCHWGETTELQFNSDWKALLDINCMDINLPHWKHGQHREVWFVFWKTLRMKIPQLFCTARTSIWPTLWYKNLWISDWTRAHCWPMFNLLSVRLASLFLWCCSFTSWSPVCTVAWTNHSPRAGRFICLCWTSQGCCQPTSSAYQGPSE